ncbi:peroxisome biogenesis factor 2-like [Sycon ciliatum]|uniref:peroxisome biogenesis factor 2-like n=1 Tax=Sycon ciliatum TaxID=27933 RepID=UPI0031F71E1A
MASVPGRGNVAALRVVQLDASELDEELVLTLRQQVVSAFRHFQPGGWLASLQPEINAVLRTLIWKHSIYSDGASFGQSMLNLTYSPADSSGISLKAKIAHGLVSVLGSWLAERQAILCRVLTRYSSIPADTLRRYVSGCGAALRLASLVNILVFLQQGQYSSLLERLLGLRTYFFRSDLRRQVGFDFLNRELLWHTFGEFLLFLLPMISVHRLKLALRSFLARFPGMQRLLGISALVSGSSQAASQPISHTSPPLECAVCEKLATCPHTADCGHFFCHYCVTANVQADEFFSCPQCNCQIRSVRPVAVDKPPS